MVVVVVLLDEVVKLWPSHARNLLLSSHWNSSQEAASKSNMCGKMNLFRNETHNKLLLSISYSVYEQNSLLVKQKFSPKVTHCN